MKKVIDVSKHNGNIQWSKVKNAVDGVIIRIGYRGYSKTGRIAEDSYAKVNIRGCQEQGIPYGVYFFPCAITTAEAQEEADWIHNYVQGMKLSFPIFLDSEVAEAVKKSGRSDRLDRTDRTNLLLVTINRLKEYGHEVGVYASTSWFNNRLDVSRFPADCSLWVAQYASKCTYEGAKIAWQYTSSASVDGVSGRCDLSEWYGSLTAQNPYTEPKRLLHKKIPMQHGNDVKWLQYELIRHGCLPEKNSRGKSNIDGLFGKDTEEAVLIFQAKVGIEIDGKVGAITRTHLKK